MKILLDECLPRRLAVLLTGHDLRTVRQMNWLGLSNGKLDPHFEVFITVDKNLVHQQRLTGLQIAVVVSSLGSRRAGRHEHSSVSGQQGGRGGAIVPDAARGRKQRNP